MLQHKKTVLIFTAVALALVALAAKIIHTNLTFEKIPREEYQMGEWVHLDGAFTGIAAPGDGTKYYSVQVVSATLKTPEEYLKSNGSASNASSYPNVKSVIDVELRIKNDGDTEGGIDIFETNLVSQNLANYYIVDAIDDNSLWPLVQENASVGFSLQPHSEMTLHLPYIINTSLDNKYKEPITDTQATFQATKMPVQKFIHVSVTQEL